MNGDSLPVGAAEVVVVATGRACRQLWLPRSHAVSTREPCLHTLCGCLLSAERRREGSDGRRGDDTVLYRCDARASRLESDASYGSTGGHLESALSSCERETRLETGPIVFALLLPLSRRFPPAKRFSRPILVETRLSRSIRCRRMPSQGYHEAKIAFVSDLEGGSVTRINLVCATAIVRLCSRARQSPLD